MSRTGRLGIAAIFCVLLPLLASCNAGNHVYQPRPGIEFRLGQYQADPGLQAIALPASTHLAYLRPGLVLGSRDIEYISSRQSDDGRWVVDFVFTAEGGRRMQQTTEANVGHAMAIMVNDKLISFSVISGVIGNRLEQSADSAVSAHAMIEQLTVRH